MTWILEQSKREQQNTVNKKIISRLDQTGHFHYLLEYNSDDRPIVKNPVILYGSTLIKRNSDCYEPGCWNTDGVKESSVIKAICSHYLNYEMKVVPHHSAIQHADEMNWQFWFVKPNVSKYFAGTVVDSKSYERFISLNTHQTTPKDFDVCISPIQQLGTEWRLVIVDSKIVEYSTYRKNRELYIHREISSKVLTFAKEMIKLHNPAPAYVLDICETKAGFKVVEYNPFNHAGLYACDIPNVVDAINIMVEK